MLASNPDPDTDPDPDFCHESRVVQVTGYRWQVAGYGLQGFGVPWGCCVFRNLKPET
jgi:hypothetical protein